MTTVGAKGLDRFVPVKLKDKKLHTHDNISLWPVAVTTDKLYKVFSKMTVKCFKCPIFLLNTDILLCGAAKQLGVSIILDTDDTHSGCTYEQCL